MIPALFSRAVAASFVPGSGNVEVWLVGRAERLAEVERAARGLLAALDQHEDAADVGGDRHYHAAREDAVYGAKCALRDSLTAAIEAATPKQEPVKASRTCWTCVHDGPGRCYIPEIDINVGQWMDRYVDGNPVENAPPCPGFVRRP